MLLIRGFQRSLSESLFLSSFAGLLNVKVLDWHLLVDVLDLFAIVLVVALVMDVGCVLDFFFHLVHSMVLFLLILFQIFQFTGFVGWNADIVLMKSQGPALVFLPTILDGSLIHIVQSDKEHHVRQQLQGRMA